MLIKHTTIVVALLVIGSPVFGQSGRYALERYRVTKKGGGLGLGLDLNQTVIVSVVMKAGVGGTCWIAERLLRDQHWCGGAVDGRCASENKVVHDWIDGDSCPELEAAFEDLAHSELSGFAPPDRPDVPMMTNTPRVSVSGPPDHIGGYGARLTLSGLAGPVVDWWSRSDELLAHCWTSALKISGEPLPPILPEE
jgi:hypothetical protein